MSFKEITLKEIGNLVPFSRPTIYNYFQTKEEIFLALFEREYDRCNKDLAAILAGNTALSVHELAQTLADSLARRQQLLKLLSMNNYDMEANSRQELLTSFKTAYGESTRLIRLLLEKFRPEMTAADIQSFLYVFFPFMFGIYPYTAVTEKQRKAMREIGREALDLSGDTPISRHGRSAQADRPFRPICLLRKIASGEPAYGLIRFPRASFSVTR